MQQISLNFWCFGCSKKFQNSFPKCKFCGSQVVQQFQGDRHSFVPFSSTQNSRNNIRRLPTNIQNFGSVTIQMGNVDLVQFGLNMNGGFFGRHNMTTPASQQVIKTLQKVRVIQCAICKEGEGEGLSMPCNHIFHEKCLLPWFKDHNTCPICRYQLDS